MAIKVIPVATEQPPKQEASQASQTDEFVAIGEFDGKLRLVTLSKDGTYRFLDSMQRLHSIVYVASSEALVMREAAEKLEALMNDPKAGEATVRTSLRGIRSSF
jgi:hypothetical protein